MSTSASHHQKSVLVDYELPSAVGFVMGQARGQTPRQDISCMLSGPILHDVHQNFAIAWRKETGEDLLACRDCDPS
ncbi:phospholipase D, partial [Pseudomonas syringae pv. actinidiae ICMP 18804]